MAIKFRAKSQGEADLLIYGDIGESFWSEESVTAKSFRKDLDAVGNVQKLNIYINSAGGNIFDAQAIVSMLQRHVAQKTVYIDGLAASAASVIAMVGDRIIIPVNAIIMIHRASTIIAGNANDMRKIAETLEAIDGAIVEVYKAKTGLPEDKIIELLNNETWMTAKEAVEYGFADEIEEAKEIAASIRSGILSINGQQFDLSKYRNAPKFFIPMVDEPGEQVKNAGRTISAANEQKLRDARDAIDEVLQQVEDAGDGGANNKREPPPPAPEPPPEPKNIIVSPEDEKTAQNSGLLALYTLQIQVNKNRR